MRLWWSSLAVLLLIACGSPVEPLDPDLTTIRISEPCGGYVRWNIEVQREVIRQDTIPHEYGDCASVLVYYVPEIGDEAYPPCWGHGGTIMADFGDRTWTCLDSSVRSFDEGAGRPFDGSACTGLELGCAYGVYRWTIPKSPEK